MTEYEKLKDQAADALCDAWACQDAGEPSPELARLVRSLYKDMQHESGKSYVTVVHEVAALATERYDG